MACPICDQKPMNCDCTPRERAMYRELQEQGDRPAALLTDAEREAVEAAVGWCDDRDTKTISTLRGLLERTK